MSGWALSSAATLVVVGAPLVIDSEAFRPSESDDERLARVIGDVVRAVKETNQQGHM
jgi:hypothetical protein